LTHLLFISSDMAPEPVQSRLATCYASVSLRDCSSALDSYYESVLDCLRRHKSESPETLVMLVEAGLWLKKRPAQECDSISPSPRGRGSGGGGFEEGTLRESAPVLLATDILGLMLQPFCRTQNTEGRVQFTDAAQLFAPQRLEAAERVLNESGVVAERGVVAAVAAPELLTAAEQRVLLEMGAKSAVTHLYLEARAARAAALPALGLVLPSNERLGEEWIEILCRLAGAA